MSTWTKKIIKIRTFLIGNFINVIVLMFLCYILNNQPLFTGENLFQYSWIEYLKSIVNNNHHEAQDEAIFINVSYDKKLIELKDEYGFPLGNTPITDRHKLTQLLQMLNTTDSYKYIFIDVNFERGYEDFEADSALIKEITKTKRIVIAKHNGTELIDSSLYNVAALNNYDATIVETNFERYQYSSEGSLSMPLYAYKDIKGFSINKWGPFYFCNGSLCYNSLFIHFPILNTNEYGENGMKLYYNLGSEILNDYSVKDLANLCDSKYVFIGDMVEDLHDTYSGIKAGPIITYYALREIMEGKHFVNIVMMFFMMILFFIISISLFKQKTWIDKTPWTIVTKSKIVRFFMSFIGYTFVLTITAILFSFIFDRYISIMLPSLYFSIQKAIIDYKRL